MNHHVMNLLAQRSASAKNMKLGKENTSCDDILDSFMLVLSLIKFK